MNPRRIELWVFEHLDDPRSEGDELLVGDPLHGQEANVGIGVIKKWEVLIGVQSTVPSRDEHQALPSNYVNRG